MSSSHRTDLFGYPLTRRSLLSTTLKAGAALALMPGVGLLEACLGSSPGSSTAPAASPRPGGTLIFGAEPALTGFDPGKWFVPYNWTGELAVFDPILTITEDGHVLAGLADLPTPNADNTLYTFHVRPGVTFHSGRELTADDAKFSLERMIAPALGSVGASLYTGLPIVGMSDLLNQKSKTLAGIQVIDTHTFTIQMQQPDSALLPLLGLPFASVVPRDVVETLGNDKFNFAPVGTGPFQMTNVDPNKGLTLQRNRSYWKPGVPYLDSVQWNVGVSPDLSLLRIQAGQQDMMFEQVPQGSLNQLRDNKNLKAKLNLALANNVFYLTLSFKHAAMQNLQVRQAIAYAVDKQKMVRILNGMAQAADGGLFTPLSPYYQPGLALKFDPQKAKQLMTAAGYSGGFDVDLINPNYTPYLEMGQSLQQDLNNIGIHVNYKPLPGDAYATIVVKNPPDIVISCWPLPYPHGSYVVDGALTTGAITAGCCNYGAWSNADFDALALQAHRTLDAKKIVDLYKQMDKIAVADDAVVVPVIYAVNAELVSQRVQGFKILSTPDPAASHFANYWLSS